MDHFSKLPSVLYKFDSMHHGVLDSPQSSSPAEGNGTQIYGDRRIYEFLENLLFPQQVP